MAERTVVPLDKGRRPEGREAMVYSGFRLAASGLTPVGSPSPEEWTECLNYLLHLEKRIHWWIGDILLYGERRWGEMYAEMIERTGYQPRTLRTLKWVSSRYDVSRRRECLSFAHHQEAAGLSSEQQDLVLTRAEREGWTREKMRHEVNRLTYEAQRPASLPHVAGLHHGDCREVMATLPDESMDLLLTDPPQCSPEALAVVDEALAVAVGKLKPNSHAYIFTSWRRYEDTAGIVEKHFGELRNTLTWLASSGAMSSDATNYVDQYELILFAHKGRRHLNGAREGDVLSFEERGALLQHLIEKSTQEQETVLDPFMHVGGTCRAARTTGRRYVGMESDRLRYDHAYRALAASTDA